MTSLDTINVQVEQSHGNVKPILNEVMHAIDRLLEAEEPTVIDLAGLPFGPGELERLEESLGRGELHAELDALGASHIRETAYPGVWWLEHRNSAGDVVGRYLEITRTPEILMSQDADILAGRARLGEMLGDKEARQ
ncbi:MAG: hydrogenase expression/formation protein [Gammaproteobacteria bacterium]|nr:hydrogenase expression/formation protein [Gammaproteobacteria bacterium]